jgi:two-component system chemotaxis sensor kinase CheA
VSAFDLVQARKGGKYIYLIQFDLIHDIERKKKTPWEVFKRLIKCGAILESVFDLDSAGTLDDEPTNRLMLEVLYSTVLQPDMLEGLVDVPAWRVHMIDKSGSAKALGEAVAVPSAGEPATPQLTVEEPAALVVEAEPIRQPTADTAPLEDSSKAASATTGQASETTIRLNVTLLDSLMTLAKAQELLHS